jgi:hypothetical protein
MFVLGLRAGAQKQVGPFSREYAFVSLSRPLLPGEVCRLEVKVYFDDFVCLGLPGLGFQLYDSLPEAFHLLTPLIDPQAKLLPFPKTDDHGRWLDLSYTFKAKGGEQILGLGCFLPEEELKLYLRKGKLKQPCRLEKGSDHQAIMMGKVRLWVAQEEKAN